MRLEVETNISEVVKKLAKYGEDVQDDVTDLINETAINVERKAKRAAPVNVGRLRGAISTDRATSGKEPRATVEVAVLYAPFVEFGTKSKVDVPAGLEGYASQFKSSGGNFDDLLENIKRWAHLKGIPKEAAYPIAVRIAREGVGAQPFLFPAWESERRPLLKKLQRMLKENASTQ